MSHILIIVFFFFLFQLSARYHCFPYLYSLSGVMLFWLWTWVIKEWSLFDLYHVRKQVVCRIKSVGFCWHWHVSLGFRKASGLFRENILVDGVLWQGFHIYHFSPLKVMFLFKRETSEIAIIPRIGSLIPLFYGRSQFKRNVAIQIPVGDHMLPWEKGSSFIQPLFYTLTVWGEAEWNP